MQWISIQGDFTQCILVTGKLYNEMTIVVCILLFFSLHSGKCTHHKEWLRKWGRVWRTRLTAEASAAGHTESRPLGMQYYVPTRGMSSLWRVSTYY